MGSKKIRKGTLVFGLIFVVFSMLACEEDDVCVGDGTPSMTVVFRDTFNHTNLKDSLTIHFSKTPDFEQSVLLYDKIFSDSLKLPLGGLDTNTVYFKIQRRSNAVADVLTVNYQASTEYTSKACGFRMTYDEMGFQSTQNYIQYLVPNESNQIKDETETNLYIVLSD